MDILHVFLGAVLLLQGRRLFWFAVGIMGFLFGFDWMTYSLTGWPAWSAWLIAVVLGALCALAAIFLQRISFALAGFLAGGFLVVKLSIALGFEQVMAPELLFILGGAIGAVVVLASVDWVLVALTSLVGAAIVTEVFSAGPMGSRLLFLALTAIGFAVQIAGLRGNKSPDRRGS